MSGHAPRRVAIVMSHASRSIGGAMRELILAAALREQGVDVRVYRIHPGQETEREEQHGIPLVFCPSDNPEEIPHRQVSAALRAEVAGFAPDLVLHKGIGYRICADLLGALPPGQRYGLIIGGATSDAIVPGAAMVFGEYPEQLERHFPAHLAAGRAMVLPKHIDLELAGPGEPAEAPEFDIVNVGTFAEKRKNQAALLPFSARHRLAFVGGGPLLRDARKASRLVKRGLPVTFFGRLPHPEVFDVLRRSRMMVHSSVGDGLPRATVEAMACGLPVIALRETIQGGIPPGCGLLVSEEGLAPAVELLTADDGLRRIMGRAARRHVEQNHGRAAIGRAALQALELMRSA